MPSFDRPFTIPEVREIVKDLFAPKPYIYWIDFLLSAGIGWGLFFLAVKAPLFSPWQFLWTFAASLAMYRALIFTHELTHLKKGTFRFFRIVWNVVVGFPMMSPSFSYEGVHMEHHVRDNYGTKTDGEYLPFGAEKPIQILLHVGLCVFLPFVFMARFVVLGPLSLFSKRLRDWTWHRASSLAIDLNYVRNIPTPAEKTTRAWMESATAIYGIAFLVLLFTGVVPWAAFFVWYAIGVLIFFMNGLRTLGAHRYNNGSGEPMTVVDQFLDSVNVPGNPVTTPLWAPVGLRFHGVHHLFPAMPYHNLGAAHRRLVRTLPKDSIYYRAISPSLFAALLDLWKRAVESERKLKAQTAAH